MITEHKARQELETLTKKEQVSLDESLRAFQLCLALGRSVEALSYADTYIHLIHEGLFNAVCSINSNQSKAFLKRFRFYWDHQMDAQSRRCYAAILLQNGIVSNYDLSVEIGINKSDKQSMQEAYQSGYCSMEPMLLKEMIRRSIAKNKLYSLPSLVVKTDSIELVDTVLCTYKCSDEDKARLLLHKAELLSGPSPERALKIIDHLEQHSSLHHGIKNLKYKLACQVVSKDRELADKLMQSIRDAECVCGYQAAIAVEKDERRDIEEIIDCVRGSRKHYFEFSDVLNDQEYIYIIESLLVKVSNHWPDIALDLYEELCAMSESGLYLSPKIAVELFPKNPNKALAIILKIFTLEDEEKWPMFAEEALVEIANMANETRSLTKILALVDYITPSPVKYAMMKILQKKMNLSFEDMYQLCSRLSPLDDIYNDKDVCLAQCKKLLELPYDGESISQPCLHQPYEFKEEIVWSKTVKY